MRIAKRTDSPAFWLALVSSSVLLHGLLLGFSAQFAGLFSKPSDNPNDWVAIEMVELPPSPTLENVTKNVEPVPSAASSSSSLAAESVPSAAVVLPPMAAEPSDRPSPVPTLIRSLPSNPISSANPVVPSLLPSSPAPLPASPVLPSQVPPSASPPSAPSPQTAIVSPPTAQVQPIEQAPPTDVPELETDEPSIENSLLPSVVMDPATAPAQVLMTLAIAQAPDLSGDAEAPTPMLSEPQQWVFEPNPITSACPAVSPGVVRQLGVPLTLQVERGPDGQVLSTTPLRVGDEIVGDETTDVADYISFVQCVVAEQWQPASIELLDSGTLLVVVTAEAHHLVE